MVVGALAEGVTPDRVLPAARSAAQELVIVEAVDIQVVSGQARIVVRFTADDAELSAQVGRHVAAVTAENATVDSWRVTQRDGSRWVPVRTAP